MQRLLDKDKTIYLKGVALLMIVANHAIGFPEWILPENMPIDSAIPWLFQLEQTICARTFKICLSLFTFFAGFGLSVKREKYESLRARLAKVLNIFVIYWAVALIFLLLGLLLKEPMPDGKGLLLNLIAFDTGTVWTNNVAHVNVSFGWYLAFYSVILLLLPLVTRLIGRGLLKDVGAILAFSFFAGGAFYVFKSCTGLNFYNLEMSVVVYTPVFLLGCITERYAVFEQINFKVSKTNFNRPFYFALLAIVVLFFKTVRDWFWVLPSLDALYTPILVFSFAKVLEFRKRKERDKGPTLLNRYISLLGRYSLGIWLLSGIFYMPARSIQWIVYLPRVSILVVVWTTLILLPPSVAIGRLTGRLKR